MRNLIFKIFAATIVSLPLFGFQVSAQEKKDIVVVLPDWYKGKTISRLLKDTDADYNENFSPYIYVGVGTDYSLENPNPPKLIVFVQPIEIEKSNRLQNRCFVAEIDPDTFYKGIVFKNVADNTESCSGVMRPMEKFIQNFLLNLMLPKR